MHAECAGVSGPGYYAAGPLLDVQDVPRKVTVVLYVLWGIGGLSNQGLRAHQYTAIFRAPFLWAEGRTKVILSSTRPTSNGSL